jgi:hypothetical protein
MLRFLEDLWSPLPHLDPAPEAKQIAQTSDDIFQAVIAFIDLLVPMEQRAAAYGECERRKAETLRNERPETYRDAFLHLASLTTAGLVVITTASGGAVKSVGTCKAGAEARSLSKDAARALFKQGVIVVAVDCFGTMSVTVRAWRLCPIHLDVERLRPHPPAEAAPAPVAISARRARARALSAAADAALLNGMWGSPQSPRAGACVAPSIAA